MIESNIIYNCLKIRLNWYNKSIDMITGKTSYENGFDFPTSTNNPFQDSTCVYEWRGAARELKNTIDMMELQRDQISGEETKWKEYLMNAITYLLETTYEEIPKDELISIIGKDIGINEKELNEIGIYIDEEGIMFDNYTNGGMTLKVDGKDIFLSTAVINELHRQENIQWGTDITANYSGDFDKAFEDITDDEFEAIAENLEEKMLSNNGDMELEAIKEVLGLE